MPERSARNVTASGKLRFSISMMNLKMSPPAPAPETLEDLLAVADVERRGLFGVKGAEGDVVLPLFLQGEISADQIHDIDAVADLFHDPVVELHP